MFKTHELVVQMQKKPKPEEAPAEPSKPAIDYSDIVATVAGGTMMVIGTYFAADTIRGIVTHLVVTKVK